MCTELAMVTKLEECEKLVALAAIGSPLAKDYEKVLSAAVALSGNAAQLDALVHCVGLHWRVTDVKFWQHVAAFHMRGGLAGDQADAWLLPSGKLLRAPAGQRVAHLPKGWSLK